MSGSRPDFLVFYQFVINGPLSVTFSCFFPQAFEYLEAALKRVIHACSVVELTSLHVVIVRSFAVTIPPFVFVQSFIPVLCVLFQDFVSEFSKRKPCVLSRSVLQVIVAFRIHFSGYGKKELFQKMLQIANCGIQKLFLGLSKHALCSRHRNRNAPL